MSGGGPTLSIQGADLVLSMNFAIEEGDRFAALRFVKQRAFRKRSEIYGTVWHIEGAFDLSTLTAVLEAIH